MPNPAHDDWIGVTAAAEILSTYPAAVRKAAVRGLIPPPVDMAGRKLWKRDVIESIARQKAREAIQALVAQQAALGEVA